MDGNTAIILLGLVVNLMAIIHFFNRIEHRVTAVEVHVVHLMRRQGMKVREDDLKPLEGS